MSLDPATNAVYEARAHEWTDARRGKSVTSARRLSERAEHAVGPLLDLGCGPGYLTAELPPGSIGLDPAAAMLDLLRERVAAATAVQGEAAHLPFRRESLGGAVVNAVYVHIDRPELPLVLAELHRVLEVGAPVELGMFGGDQDLTQMTTGDFAGRRFALWDDEHLADVLRGAGFGIDAHTRSETDNWPYLLTSLTRLRSLPDTVGPGMRLLVCGLNPSLHSADLGVGFGRGGNRFWPAALAAGLVSVDRDARHALTEHGIGMTDLVKRATPRADEISAEEYREGVARLERLCAWLRPAAVCMVGLAGWRVAVDRKAVVGWQTRTLGGGPVYVMPSTSGLNAHSQLPDLTEHLRERDPGAMTGPGPLLVGFLSVAVSAASCTVVDEPGSHGPVRTTTTITELAVDATEGVLSCPAIPPDDDELPSDRRAAIDAALLAPGFHELDVSISIWIEGYGEVAAVNADHRLLPASNQKLFTAMGAYSLLERSHRFTTEVIHGEGVLTLVAGGDPTLRLTGEHSLAALARQTAASGVAVVETLSVDADHFEFARMAAGWQDWHIPDYVGPLSAITVNDNRYRIDEEFLFGPAIGNLESFADALRTVGVDTSGARIDPGVATAGEVVATLRSPPMEALLPDMLRRSDNETAEAILREIGGGSTAGGIEVVDGSLDALCTDRSGQSGDGSGLSRSNLRSAREWRSLLQAAAATSWGADFRAALPTAGRNGTLSRRLTGSTTAGNVVAKTGSIIGGQALSGYASTSDGRELVFSIIVNGDPAAARSSRSAIDALVVAAVG